MRKSYFLISPMPENSENIKAEVKRIDNIDQIEDQQITADPDQIDRYTETYINKVEELILDLEKSDLDKTQKNSVKKGLLQMLGEIVGPQEIEQFEPEFREKIDGYLEIAGEGNAGRKEPEKKPSLGFEALHGMIDGIKNYSTDSSTLDDLAKELASGGLDKKTAKEHYSNIAIGRRRLDILAAQMQLEQKQLATLNTILNAENLAMGVKLNGSWFANTTKDISQAIYLRTIAEDRLKIVDSNIKNLETQIKKTLDLIFVSSYCAAKQSGENTDAILLSAFDALGDDVPDQLSEAVNDARKRATLQSASPFDRLYNAGDYAGALRNLAQINQDNNSEIKLAGTYGSSRQYSPKEISDAFKESTGPRANDSKRLADAVSRRSRVVGEKMKEGYTLLIFPGVSVDKYNPEKNLYRQGAYSELCMVKKLPDGTLSLIVMPINVMAQSESQKTFALSPEAISKSEKDEKDIENNIGLVMGKMPSFKLLGNAAQTVARKFEPMKTLFMAGRQGKMPADFVEQLKSMALGIESDNTMSFLSVNLKEVKKDLDILKQVPVGKRGKFEQQIDQMIKAYDQAVAIVEKNTIDDFCSKIRGMTEDTLMKWISGDGFVILMTIVTAVGFTLLTFGAGGLVAASALGTLGGVVGREVGSIVANEETELIATVSGKKFFNDQTGEFEKLGVAQLVAKYGKNFANQFAMTLGTIGLGRFLNQHLVRLAETYKNNPGIQGAFASLSEKVFALGPREIDLLRDSAAVKHFFSGLMRETGQEIGEESLSIGIQQVGGAYGDLVGLFVAMRGGKAKQTLGGHDFQHAGFSLDGNNLISDYTVKASPEQLAAMAATIKATFEKDGYTVNISEDGSITCKKAAGEDGKAVGMKFKVETEETHEHEPELKSPEVEKIASEVEMNTFEQDFNKIKNHPKIAQIMSLIAKRLPHAVFEFRRLYSAEPYNSQVLEVAGMKLAESESQAELTSLLFKMPNLITEKFALKITEKAIRKLLTIAPESVLHFADLFVNQPFAEEIIREVAKKDPGSVIAHLELFCDKPYAEEVIREAAERDAGAVLFVADQIGDLSKLPHWFEDVVRSATELVPKYAEQLAARKKEPPILDFQIFSPGEVSASDKPPQGFSYLYRGIKQDWKEPDREQWFTDDLDAAKAYAGGEGKVVRIAVRSARVMPYVHETGVIGHGKYGVNFALPAEWFALAKQGESVEGLSAEVRANLAIDDSDGGVARRAAMEKLFGEPLTDPEWSVIWQMHLLGGSGMTNVKHKKGDKPENSKLGLAHEYAKTVADPARWEKIYKLALKKGIAGNIGEAVEWLWRDIGRGVRGFLNPQVKAQYERLSKVESLTEPQRMMLAELFPEGIEISNFKQTNTGLCYFYAALHSLKRHPLAPHIFANMIVKNGKNWLVTWPGETKAIEVKSKDLAGQKVFDPQKNDWVFKKTVAGQLGDRVLDVAFAKRRAAKARDKGKDVLHTRLEAESGWMMEGLEAFLPHVISNKYEFGEYRDRLNANRSMQREVEILFANFANNPNGYLLTAATPGGLKTPFSKHTGGEFDKVKYYMDPEYKFVQQHAYTIIAVNAGSRTVTIANPHDNAKETVISYERFFEYFALVQGVKLDQTKMEGVSYKEKPSKPGVFDAKLESAIGHKFSVKNGVSLNLGGSDIKISESGGVLYLHLKDAKNPGMSHKIGQINPGVEINIGRGTVSGMDEKVSATHARVKYLGNGEILVTDLNSRNGTMVSKNAEAAPVRAPVPVPVAKPEPVRTPEFKDAAIQANAMYSYPVRGGEGLRLELANPTTFFTFQGGGKDIVMRGQEGQIFYIKPEETIVIGREAMPWLPGTVSKKHVEVTNMGNGNLLVRDLGSRGGTKVNKVKLY